MQSVFTILLFTSIGLGDAIRLPPPQRELLAAQNNPRKQLVVEAYQKLEKDWPLIDGRAMLKAATDHIPAGDGGAKLRARLRDRLKAKKTFVFAAFGSSVTAGHDNYFNSSWPVQLEKILKPTFEKLGFGFEARNRGMGGWGEMPYAAGCLANRAGSGVDALSWEWNMFGDSPCEKTHFIREAYDMERNPVIFSLANSEIDWKLTLNKEIRKRLGDEGAERQMDEEKGYRTELLQNKDVWNGLDSGYKDPEFFLREEFISKDFMSQFESEIDFHDEKYDSEVTCNNKNMRIDGNLGFEMNSDMQKDIITLAVEASTPHFCHVPFYMAREKVFNTNWHPGPLGHYLIASQIAHNILENLAEVMDHEFEVSLARSKFNNDLEGHGPTADNPVVDRAQHITDEQKANLYNSCGELTTRKCWTGVEPNTGSLKIFIQPGSEWKFGTSPQAKTNSLNVKLGHLDKRFTLQGKQSSGTLELKVQIDTPSPNEQFVLLCGTSCGWNCHGAFGYLSPTNNRWWNDDAMKAQFSDTACESKSPDECNAYVGYKKGAPRPEVVDFAVNVNGKDVDSSALGKMQEELFDENTGVYCRNCPKVKDQCQPVAKLSHGEHLIKLTVDPKTYKAPKVAAETLLEIGQIMLIGA